MKKICFIFAVLVFLAPGVMAQQTSELADENAMLRKISHVMFGNAPDAAC